MIVDGRPMSGSLFDFGLFFWHNAKESALARNGPVFLSAQNGKPPGSAPLERRVPPRAGVRSDIKRGTIKATVLIETILATFEMDEILYELREHSSGLNCGRWDYIFSFIKKFANDPAAVLPDRGRVTMTTHFMRSYSKLVIKTCHRREVHAMGGMSAYIPNKRDPVANQTAMEQVRADKEREASDGHDGTWVAHPGLVALAKEVFDRIYAQAKSDRPQARRRPDHGCGFARCSQGRDHRSRACAKISRSASAIWSPGCAGSGCVPLVQSHGGCRDR